MTKLNSAKEDVLISSTKEVSSTNKDISFLLVGSYLNWLNHGAILPWSFTSYRDAVPAWSSANQATITTIQAIKPLQICG